MDIICPKCNSKNTQFFSDTKTKDHGYTCLDCHIDFGVNQEKEIENIKKNFKEMTIHYKKNNNIYNYLFKKVSNIVTLKIDTYSSESHFNYDLVEDVSKEFDELITVFINQLFILDLNHKEIDNNLAMAIKIVLNNQVIEIISQIDKYYESLLSELMETLLKN